MNKMIHLRHFLPLQMLLIATFARLQAIAEHITQTVKSQKSDRRVDRPVRAISTPEQIAGEIRETSESLPEHACPAPAKSRATRKIGKCRPHNAIDAIFG